MVQKNYSARYYAYTGLLGLVGFALLLYLTVFPLQPFRFDWLSFAIFTLLAFGCKFLSFRLMGVVTLSMDTAVYITALLCLGAVPAAWTVFFSMYMKIIWDTINRELVTGTEERPFLENILAPLFQGGTGGLAALAAGLFLPVSAFVSGEMVQTWNVIWLAPAAALIFVLIQYTTVLHKYALLGYSWKNLFGQALLPGLLTETILIPLAMVMALTYHGQGEVSLPFIILVATYVIVNFIFKKLSDARGRLDERVKDLQSLNRMGRTICSTLQADDLVSVLARQTLDVVEDGDSVMVYVWNDETGEYESIVEHKEGKDPARFELGVAVDLAARAVESRIPFSSGRLQPGQEGTRLTELKGLPLPPGSWMGIPVQVEDQAIGAVVLYSGQPEGFPPARLGLLQMIGQQAAVALQNSRLYVLATVDGLTKLFVRRYFDRRLSEEAARSRRYGTTFSIMLLDFDDFKDINDTHGHAVGDVVLRTIADIVLTEVRSIDIPARFGGDEFAIVLPEVDAKGAEQLAQRIVSRVKRERIRSGAKVLSTSLSIGVASFPQHASTDGTALLAAADQGLYKAKRAGKGQVGVADAE